MGSVLVSAHARGMRIARVDVYGYDLTLRARHIRHVGRPRDRQPAEHGRARDGRRRDAGLRRDVPARPGLPAGARRRRARGAARARAGAARPRSARDGGRERRDGRGAARPRLRQERRGRRLLGRARQGHAGSRSARCSAVAGRSPSRSTSPCRSGRLQEMAAHVQALRAEGIHQLPAQARRRSARGRRARARGARRDGGRATS